MSEIKLPKEHDFTTSKWGWAISKVYDDNTGVAQVQEIDYYLNVHDMFKMKIVPIGYKD